MYKEDVMKKIIGIVLATVLVICLYMNIELSAVNKAIVALAFSFAGCCAILICLKIKWHL